jgi:hypothetical protein
MDRVAESTDRGTICRCRRLPCHGKESSTNALQVGGCRQETFAELLANSEDTMVGEGRKIHTPPPMVPASGLPIGLLFLDGEGVFEALHVRLQILDFAPLFFQEQVFDAVKPCLHLGTQCSHIFLDLVEILLGGRGLEPFVDHCGERFDYYLLLCHMYVSIDEPRGVSMAGVVTRVSENVRVRLRGVFRRSSLSWLRLHIPPFYHSG